jgi:3-deoxy-D-manno-octulosonic-acid transferase
VVPFEDPWKTVLERAHGAPLVVAGSTHAPEEEWLVEALVELRYESPGARLILAPRHPRRARRVGAMAKAAGLSVAFWSDDHLAAAVWEVLVLDRVGLLPAVYQWADIAVIGGSLSDHGGHNPMEAAIHGRAVLIGPFYENFRDTVGGLEEAGGVFLLPNRDLRRQSTEALLKLASDPRRREVLGARALSFARSQGGTGRRYAESLLTQLERAQLVAKPHD